jgi:acetyl/propionyl-CoA carboxylase alpha subunit
MEKILADTHLNKEMKDSLYASNCSAGRSREKIIEIYESMTAEQRKDIRTAFTKNGYEVNHGSECCGP